MPRQSRAARLERERTCRQEFSNAQNTREPELRARAAVGARGTMHSLCCGRQELNLGQQLTKQKACITATAEAVPWAQMATMSYLERLGVPPSLRVGLPVPPPSDQPRLGTQNCKRRKSVTSVGRVLVYHSVHFSSYQSFAFY